MKPFYVLFLLDQTGSMSSIKEETIAGFNAYIDQLKKSDPNVLFSLILWDSSKQEVRYRRTPIASVLPLTEHTYHPGSATPLIDVCVKSIVAAEKAAREVDADRVMVVVQTDGYENCSREYTNGQLADLLKRKEGDGWAFTFLAANMDAFAQARQIGFSAGMTLSYRGDKSQHAFVAAATRTSAYGATGQSVGYTVAERVAAGDPGEANISPAPPASSAQPQPSATDGTLVDEPSL
jgi:hypothetical protein